MTDIWDDLAEASKACPELKPAVAIFSGGLDSTTLVYHMLNEGYHPHLLSFNYGQRHVKELAYAKATAYALGLRHDIIDLTGITHLISNSALTSPFVDGTEAFDADLVDFKRNIEVPEGHYAEETMKATVVPNRNMIMLSIAAGVAVNEKAATIGIGVHAGDHFVYPDCRPKFVDDLSQAIVDGTEGFSSWEMEEDKGQAWRSVWPICAPFINWSKADIAYRALELGVPLEQTWSCYKGGEKHCGKCGTCVERLEAIDEAQLRFMANKVSGMHDIMDNTEYEDDTYWKEAVK